MDYLPIFTRIQNQPCVIVGGGAVAARKADLLIKAGANVMVIAPALKTEMQFHLSNGQIHWQQAEYSDDIMASLTLPKLVISATDNQVVNKAVYAYCQAHNIPINVADKTELCDFILPAIIDRNPMIVAVSTGGRSPVLARVMKAKLETLIPHGFSQLTQWVGQYRQKVKQTIQSIEGRKTFWETLLSSFLIDKVVQGKVADADAIFNALLHESQGQETQGQSSKLGEVYLIGAGPGDPDLMTFKGLKLLQQADVILYDRLVSPEILDMARREAERIYVGKKDKYHAIPQQDISQMMVDLAQQGKKVARLKGGDPYIFGRGAEEVELLAQNNIPYQVVPGITAASGCAAYADFPLTHRDYSQSVALITGHQQAGAKEIDYARLAQSGDTMVFYMGIKNAPKIQTGLLVHGMLESTPVAIIENGTRPSQRETYTSLGQLSETLETNHIKPPALLIVGEVIRVRDRLKLKVPPTKVSQ